MNIWIDDTQIEQTDDLDTALESARVHAESQGRLIVDILVNGQPATDAFFEENMESLPPITDLHFTTADTATLVSDTIETAIESIELLKADQQAGAVQLREGDMENSMQTLRAIMEGWQAMRDIVDQITQITDLDINTLTIDQQPATEIINKLSKSLEDVRETLKNEDWSLLGDVIEYDLNELADQWSTLLSTMKSEAAPA
jgi:hypothetical protein